MTTAFLGPRGTYTEDAARAVGESVGLLPRPTVDSVFEAVAGGEAERGVVPIENVIQGPVTETLDNLFRHAARVAISDMLLLAIRHALGTLGPGSRIERVLSKDQALKQCSAYLRASHPEARLRSVDSTSAAMEAIAGERLADAAAIGSETALKRYGLHVAARDIGNVKRNQTRFAVLGPASEPGHPRTGRDATAFALHPRRDRPGLLYDILGVISRGHGLNLSSIHSRPDSRGAFVFHMEIDGHPDDAPVAACLAHLARRFGGEEVDFRVFGSYPRRGFGVSRE